MTFNRDVNCYRATPRTLQTSKFGCYAELSVIPTRRRSVWPVICYAAVAISAVLIALALGGCGQATAEPEHRVYRPVFYQDAETGCWYVAGGISDMALTPRLDSDSRPMCGKASKTKAVTLVSR